METRRHNGLGVDLTGSSANLDRAFMLLNKDPMSGRIDGFNEGLVTAAGVVKRFRTVGSPDLLATRILGTGIGDIDGYTMVKTADLARINQLLENSLRMLQEMEQRKQ